jgi:hypothetical protein
MLCAETRGQSAGQAIQLHDCLAAVCASQWPTATFPVRSGAQEAGQRGSSAGRPTPSPDCLVQQQLLPLVYALQLCHAQRSLTSWTTRRPSRLSGLQTPIRCARHAALGQCQAAVIPRSCRHVLAEPCAVCIAQQRLEKLDNAGSQHAERLVRVQSKGCGRRWSNRKTAAVWFACLWPHRHALAHPCAMYLA